MVVVSFDLKKARQAVDKAKRALKAAEEKFDGDCGVDNSLSLIREIKAAERRLAKARLELRQLQPGTHE
jgi:hypothetical protein